MFKKPNMLKGKTCIPVLAVRNFWDVFAEERRNCHFMSPWLRETNLKLSEVSELIKQAKSISHCTSKQKENKNQPDKIKCKKKQNNMEKK